MALPQMTPAYFPAGFQRHPSRREFLRAAAAGAASAAVAHRFHTGVVADDREVLPAGKSLVVRSASPFNAEPSLEELVGHWITPVETFYVRNHGATPLIDLAAHELTVEGLVDRPLKIGLAELSERFPALDQTATLTCAGNRRNEFTGPKIAGVPWSAGAIGNARWSGPGLRALLKHAGIKPEASHVWFEGADDIVDKTSRYPFGGSIPLERVLAGDDLRGSVLLATGMNDRPLTAEHGFPLRVVVPGFIGARSVKWLRRIVVSDRPSPNHYVAHAYKLITEETPAVLESTTPLYEYVVNSVICDPAPAKPVAAGRLRVRGFALPGGGAGRTLDHVELSADGGQNWTRARLISPQRDYCWSLWSANVEVTSRTERLLVRATDSAGAAQPREMPWNLKGYQYNAWHGVELKTG